MFSWEIGTPEKKLYNIVESLCVMIALCSATWAFSSSLIAEYIYTKFLLIGIKLSLYRLISCDPNQILSDMVG